MSYLKERYSFPNNVVLSAPREGERVDSVQDGWICFYEIAFKLGLRLPFHRVINMVLNYFNLAPRQLMPNGWHYLLGLAKKADTLSMLNGKSETYRTRQLVIKVVFRLLYGEPSDPLWTSYLANDMGKMKVRIPTDAELAEKERKKKEKRAARQAGGSVPSKDPEPTPGGTTLIQLRDLVLATSAKKSPPQKKQRHSSPLALNKDKGKAPQAPKRNLGLEDSASVCSEPNQVTEIVDSLMTQHGRVILKGMTFEDINHKAEQCALKVCSEQRWQKERGDSNLSYDKGLSLNRQSLRV
ncbi:hypothetical protein FNV43_RR13325 [Rhamnella rubrinervis]|uniref:Transposase (putative) gypsy type domain-containing protein n=1 Tax=Rhamnella rubrinervis TaxID=2594499 RepID=A0A8K0H0Y2_9ROSA|nr:hypothetical protein FNV43_RR13325 [Rhamnella rubrinervis]